MHGSTVQFDAVVYGLCLIKLSKDQCYDWEYSLIAYSKVLSSLINLSRIQLCAMQYNLVACSGTHFSSLLMSLVPSSTIKLKAVKQSLFPCNRVQLSSRHSEELFSFQRQDKRVTILVVTEDKENFLVSPRTLVLLCEG